MPTINSSTILATKPRRAAGAATRHSKVAPRIKAVPNKSEIVARLLARPKGATVAEVSGATGWQPHSVRAFLSGLRKKGSALDREARKDGTSCHRLIRTDANSVIPAAETTAATSDGVQPAETGDEV